MGSQIGRRKLVVIGITGFTLLILVAIGGLVFWGRGLFVDQAKEAFNDNSVIHQHIGAVDEIEVDFTATARADGEDVFVFRIEGPKETGVVTAELVSVDAD